MDDVSAISCSQADGQSAGGPDWSQVGHEVRCPLCEYNLYGLTTPRCPECGYPFEWAVVLDPAFGRHPYLIEHHTDTLIRSYFATAFGALRPRRFWESLHPGQRVRPVVLAGYAGLGAMMFLVMMLFTGALALRAWYELMTQRYGPGLSLCGGINPPLWQILLHDENMRPAVLLWAFDVLWIPVTLATLCVFSVSMKRAKVRLWHLLRCVIYSLDPATWVVLCLVFGLVPLASLLISPAIMQAIGAWNATVATCAILFGLYRLWAGLRFYLRLERPFLILLASQSMVLLVAANVY